MNTHTLYFEPQPLGWGSKLLAAVAATLLLIGGFFFSLLLLAVGGTFMALTLLRLWWANRKLQRPEEPITHTHNPQVIEAEYYVRRDEPSHS